MRLSNVISLAVAAIVLDGIAIGLMLPNQSPDLRFTFIISIVASSLTLLAVPLFLHGIKQFKVELRRAYKILCFGIGVFGLAQIQLTLVSLFTLDFWLRSGAVAIPYLLGVIGIFYGVRAFARLLGIKTVWVSPIVALAVTVAISLAASRLPHVAVPDDELSFQLALSLSIWNSVFITFAAIAAFYIRSKIGESYRRSANWLCAALSIIAFAGWHYSFVQLTMTTGNWYYDYSFNVIPFAAGALALVIAGYTFSTTNTLDTRVTRSTASVDDSSLELDIVLYLASLASRPADIDATLDSVRRVTSRQSGQPGNTLSTEDKSALADVYHKLETYLLNDDPLRTFSQDELRQGVAAKFSLTDNVRALLWQAPVLNQSTPSSTPITTPSI